MERESHEHSKPNTRNLNKMKRRGPTLRDEERWWIGTMLGGWCHLFAKLFFQLFEILWNGFFTFHEISIGL